MHLAIGGAKVTGQRPTRSLSTYLLLSSVVVLWAPALTSVGDLNLNFVLTIGMALFAFGLAAQGGLVASSDTKAFWTLVLTACALAGFSLISFAWAEQPFRVFRAAYGQIFGVVVLWLVTRTSDRRMVFDLRDMIVLGALVSSVFVTVGAYLPPLRSLLFSGDRTAGFFREANQFGIVLGMTFPMLVGFVFYRNLKPIFAVGLCVILYMGLAMAGSKTNLVLAALTGLGMVVATMLIRGTFVRKPHLAAITLIGVLGGSVIGYVALEAVNPRAHRVLMAFATKGEAKSIDDRQRIQAYSIEEGKTHPWGGTGAGQRTFAGRVTHSHNVFIDYFRSLGVPGLALVTAQVLGATLLALAGILSAVRARGTPESARILACGAAFSMLSYIAGNQMSDSFGPSTVPFFWLSTAMLFVARWHTAGPLRTRGR